MKKRVFSALLTLVLALALLPAPVRAADSFSDVKDPATERNVEVLRLLGVLSGYPDGTFRPDGGLTRAEFCKMSVELLGRGTDAERYRARTIFPDVRAEHWASGYVNFAVNYQVAEGQKMIRGLPDGTFAPDADLTFGQAVTILMRLLGYSDTDAGAIWPDGYIDLAHSKGVSDGVAAAGGSVLTRAQAAQLFVNVLGKEAFLARLGATLSAETTFRSVDLARGKLYTADAAYDMKKPMAGTALSGLRGSVVLIDGKAVTFLPVTGSVGAASAAAILVSADGSAAGFEVLTGGATKYDIYRNGSKVDAGALRRYDVATWAAASGTIQVCDTRVLVTYEDCEPSPAAPTRVTVLGGTVFAVTPEAQQSVAAFKPGRTMLLLLTADGRIAAALDPNDASGLRGNAVGFVDAKGVVNLICGGSLLPLALSDPQRAGQAVLISQPNRQGVTLSPLTGGVTGTLDAVRRTFGERKLADNALIFDAGENVSVESLVGRSLPASAVLYAGTNADGEVDLLVIDETTVQVFYGRAVVKEDFISTGDFLLTSDYLQVEYGSDKASPYAPMTDIVASGDYVEAIYKGGRYTGVVKLTKLEGVAPSAWIGTSAVNVNGQTYTVSADAACYNRDSGRWFADVRAALAYGGTMDLYLRDGVVRAIEVSY